MGNGLAKVTHCFSGGGGGRRRHIAAAVTSEPYEEGLGHSFCYVRPEIPPTTTVSELVAPSEESTTFRSISGASVSANASTPLSTCLLSELTWPAAAAFDCSTSFASVPLHPIPRSGPLGFLSGPIDRERGFMSGPLAAGLFSGPLADRPPISGPLRRSLSHAPRRTRRAASSLVRGLTRAIARTVTWHGSIVAPVKCPKESAGHISSQTSIDDGAGGAVGSSSPSSAAAADSGNLQWAQGKAGEDRVHVVISEEYGWVFVGIYDGFNGPDATDYLLSNLYPTVHRELKGLLWEENYDSENTAAEGSDPSTEEEGHPKLSKIRSSRSQRRWKCDWDRERLELDKKLKEQLSKMSPGDAVNHQEVLEALSKALRKTEDAYLDVADKMASENPELALMGSCVLVMLMKGEDVYLMNVGDSRAVLAQNELDLDFSGTIRKARQDLARISEEAYCVDDQMGESPCLAALQLSLDHSTSEEEEVYRIKSEHPDDASAIANDRVKGSLKVTRAFGAGFLKQPKWNEALLEVFRIHYVGTLPYITCNPYLYHHKLGPRDKFLILSSDGLYQYFTNEEAVTEVEYFISTTPEGDPAQHLVEEVLFRAANKAGMDFYELLEIPQGDRRRYHDDVSIIVISFEGRIWRSCV